MYTPHVRHTGSRRGVQTAAARGVQRAAAPRPLFASGPACLAAEKAARLPGHARPPPLVSGAPCSPFLRRDTAWERRSPEVKAAVGRATAAASVPPRRASTDVRHHRTVSKWAETSPAHTYLCGELTYDRYSWAQRVSDRTRFGFRGPFNWQ